MRLILFLFLLTCSKATAHDTFFAFAEMEYNEISGKMEATVSVTAHDLEKYYQKEGKIKGELSKELLDSSVFRFIESELNKHFYLDLDPFGENSTMDGVEMVNFRLEGFEFELNGLVRFYLSCDLSRPIESTFGITFNLLMDTNAEQQNKLTFIHREKKATFVFLQTNQKQFIDIH
jgi:hypothetical protein